MPKPLKQTLTTLQITQFVVGTLYAFSHLFIEYQSPVDIPYIYHLGDVVSAVASDASTAVSSVAVAVTSAASQIDWWAVGRKIALRAAGREGLAQNVVDRSGHTFGIDAKHAARDFTRREETRYRHELVWTHCLDTSGQTFAILLNCVYLLPLTWLFVRFFIRSYIHRVERRRSSTVSQKAYIASQSVRDAGHGVGRRMSEAFEVVQEGVENGDDFAILDDIDVKEELDKAGAKARAAAASVKDEVKVIAGKSKELSSKVVELVSEKAQELKAKAQHDFQGDLAKAKEQLKDAKDEAVTKADEYQKAAGEKVDSIKDDVSKEVEKNKEKAPSKVPSQEGDKPTTPKDDEPTTATTAKDENDASASTSKDEKHVATTADSSSSAPPTASTESASGSTPGERDVVKEVIQDTKIAPLDSSYVEVDTTKKDQA